MLPFKPNSTQQSNCKICLEESMYHREVWRAQSLRVRRLGSTSETKDAASFVWTCAVPGLRAGAPFPPHLPAALEEVPVAHRVEREYQWFLLLPNLQTYAEGSLSSNCHKSPGARPNAEWQWGSGLSASTLPAITSEPTDRAPLSGPSGSTTVEVLQLLPPPLPVQPLGQHH